MTYNQSVLNNYRSELLHEAYVGEEETLYIRLPDNVQLESPSEQHCQQVMEENTLNAQEKQKANDQIDHDNKNSDDIQSSDVLLLIQRFKSKTCPYCNGQRDANVKHINPHTKPSTPQAFYNDILINKYRHVQSPHAQYNLTLNIDVDCNAGNKQQNDVTMHIENSLLQKECKEEQMQKLAEEKKQCKQEIIQKEDNVDIVLASTATADHVEQYEQHKLYTNSNVETDNVKLETHEGNNKYSTSKLFVVGPMVDQSELPFRMLCREYGATVAFTPMLHAKNFVESAQYRQRFYSTTSKREVLHALQEQNENEKEKKEEEHQEELEKHYEENLCHQSCVESCRLQQEQQQECEEKEQNEEVYKYEKADKHMESKHNKLIDRPLVVQICGNDADTILAAARLVLYSDDYGNKSNDKCDGKKEGHHDNNKQRENEEVTANVCDSCITTKESKDDEHKQEDAVNYKMNSQNVSNNASDTFPLYSCDAVDINLGCPQGIAKRGHYGSFLMEDWERIHTIIHTLHVELEVPVTAKIRVFDKPQSAKHHLNNINNNENIDNNIKNIIYNNVVSNNNFTNVAARCNVNGKIGIKVNEENKLTQSVNDIDTSKECTNCVELLVEHDHISHDQSHQNHKQRTEDKNDHSMHKMQESDQSMELNQMCTMELHQNCNDKVEEDYYIVRCNKQDSESSSSNSSDDSLEYDAALTIAYAMMIRDAGAQMLTVHGRTRAMKGQNTKLANLSLIREIHSALNGSIPIIANGNVLTFDDVMQNMKITHCDGVMCAEPLLWDPSLFAHPTHPILCGRSFAADKITRLRAIQLALRYVSWCACYPVELGMIKAHLYKLCYHSYEIHCTLRNALAHACEDDNLLSTSSTPFEENKFTKAEAGNTACYKFEQTILQENACKQEKVASGHCNLYMQQLNALRRHLHELYKTEEASTITGPQPKLLRLAKEANRAELHANNFFDDTNYDNGSMGSAKLKENNNAECNDLNDESKPHNGDKAIRDEDDDDNTLGIVF